MKAPLALFALLVVLVLLGGAVHKVEEGHVGVYYRGGALVERVTEPGMHLKLPLVDEFHNVQVTMQTDKVQNIPCGTSGGVVVMFDKVEVVNRLKKSDVFETIKNYTVDYDKPWIFDKIHHEVNQLCSQHTLQEVYIDLFHTVDDILLDALQKSCDVWAPGIEVVSIRVTKPRIPEGIRKNYEAMEAEKTKLMVATQAQKVQQKEAETEKMKATIEAEKQREVAAIASQQQIAQEEAQLQIKRLNDEAMLNHEKAVAEAEFFAKTKQAEANQLLYSENYLKLEAYRAIGNSTKIYFGPSVQNMLLDVLESVSGGSSAPKLAKMGAN